MLAKELVVGQSYVAKVSGRLTTVRLDEIARSKGYKRPGYRRNASTHYHCVNEKTGRQVTLKSALKFRRVVLHPDVPQAASAAPQTVQAWTDPFERIRGALRDIRDRSEGMNTLAKIRIMRTCDKQFMGWGEVAQNALIRQVLAE